MRHKALRRKDFKTTSPQGDGNRPSTYSYTSTIPSISKPHPRKGTETRCRYPRRQTLQWYISKPHPRKGTETPTENANVATGQNFKTTSPQGDGNIEHGFFRVNADIEFQNHIPARGRKRFRACRVRRTSSQDFKTTSPQGDGNCYTFRDYMRLHPCDFKTTSPQGDGNAYKAFRALRMLRIISKPHPRKGTAHTRGGYTKLKLRTTASLFFCNFLDSL